VSFFFLSCHSLQVFYRAILFSIVPFFASFSIVPFFFYRAILCKCINSKYLSYKTLAFSHSRPSRGKAFPPHPHFHPVPGFHFSWVAPLLPRRGLCPLTCPPLAANSSPPASRATAEGLRFAAFDYVAFAPCRPLRLCRTVRFSHIRYAAHTALLNRATTFGAGKELQRGVIAIGLSCHSLVYRVIQRNSIVIIG